MARAINNLRAAPSIIREAESMYDVHRLVMLQAAVDEPESPPHAVWLVRTRRLLVMLRAVTMIRSCDAAGIIRSTIRRTKHPWCDRQLVVFHYTPKGAGAPTSRRRKQAVIEIVPEPWTRLCVGTLLMEYKQLVDNLVGDKHNSLFIASKRPHTPLSRDRLRTIVTSVLEDQGIDATAHSLRLMSRDKLLKFHDEPGEVDGALWANANVAVRHYQSGFRRPEVNFTLAIGLPVTVLAAARERFGNIFESSLLTVARERWPAR